MGFALSMSKRLERSETELAIGFIYILRDMAGIFRLRHCAGGCLHTKFAGSLVAIFPAMDQGNTNSQVLTTYLRMHIAPLLGNQTTQRISDGAE